jgi:predicted aspartyl protease
MDELLWGREHEDVSDWAERLTMAAEVRDLNADKLFKIAKLNLRGRVREWLRRLQPAPADWSELRTAILLKYGNVDDDDIRAKLDAIKQEPRETVQRYFERLDRLFWRGKITDIEQRRRFLARLRPEIRKLCVVRNFTNIEELVGAASEVERVLGELGETPFEPLKEEQEEGVTEMSMEHQVANLNNALINFFKGGVPNSIPPLSPNQFNECRVCKGRDHVATSCLRQIKPRPKCAKCGMPHRTENCGIKCSFCSGLGHSEDRCWKRSKDRRPSSGAANFLEVLLDDEAATAQQLDRLCGNENVFAYTRIPRRRMPVETPPIEVGTSAGTGGEGVIPNRESSIRSKILSHFIKGRISLMPMETVMLIAGELEQLENLVKVARRKKDAESETTQVSLVSSVPTLKRICVNKTHKSKILHLSVEINNCLIEGLVATGASMSVMAVAVVRELGLMHLVSGSESYKTVLGAVTQALGRIKEVQIKVGGVQCNMTFMVVDTDSYDVLLGLDLLIKIGAIVDVEQGLIQVRRGPGTDVEVLPLTMVNLV